MGYYSLFFMIFNISFSIFSCLRRLGLRFNAVPLIPFLSTMTTDLPAWFSPPWWSCIATALARSSSAGVAPARVALPVSPARQGSSGQKRPHHHAHGKVARVREEPVPSPRRHRVDDDYTPSEDGGGSTSGSSSERLNSVLSLACFVCLFFGGPLCLGAWALGLGSWGRE
jgi:hypothetical protein